MAWPRIFVTPESYLNREEETIKEYPQLQPLTSVAPCTRVFSDRQDLDLSVPAQMRVIRAYAEANGYNVAREYTDEAENGRIADRPKLREMIDEVEKSNSTNVHGRQNRPLVVARRPVNTP